MRIGLLASPRIAIPPKKYGGIERVVYFLIKGLKELGHEVILFGTKDSEVDCEVIGVENAIPFALTPEEEKIYNEKTKDVHERTLELVKKNLHRIDILNVHEEQYDITQFKNFPNLTTIHNPFAMGFNTNPYLARKDQLFYSTVSYNQQKPIPFLRYAAAIYNCLDSSEFPFNSYPQTNTQEYVCFIGRLDPAKQPHLAIWFAIRNNIKIKVAGNYNFANKHYYETELKPLFDNHPLVEYVGEVGMEEKVKLLSNAVCNLHPISFREPFGLTVIEAAYCGTPTIAIRRGSMPEIIEDGKTGILVEDFDEATYMLEKVRKFDRQYISEKAKKLYNYPIMAKQYEKVYENILKIFENNPSLEAHTLEGQLRDSVESVEEIRRQLTILR
jgi:glycosyltransferase involved in cell wall biosynthesis